MANNLADYQANAIARGYTYYFSLAAMPVWRVADSGCFASGGQPDRTRCHRQFDPLP